MNYNEALALIHSTAYKGSVPGLERIQKLLDLLGNPEKKLSYVHVAGTNGKGSVCAMLSSVLREAGYRVGLFTSPYMFQFEEQFQVNGKLISQDEIVLLTEQLAAAMEKMEEKPTEFEILTTLGFLYFVQQKCDLVILEVGMGGILDSTNVIPAPMVAVITGLGYDHMQFLGNTLSEIAAAKAGIIKPGCMVCTLPQQEMAAKTIQQIAEEAGAPVMIAAPQDLVIAHRDANGQTILTRKYGALTLSLPGDYQAENFSLVLTVLDALEDSNFKVPLFALQKGLKQVSWPGRFEFLKDHPAVVVDGAHNPHGINGLIQNLKTYFPGKRFIFLTGVLKDKNYTEMLQKILPFAAEFITITPNSPRAMEAAEYANVIASLTELPVTIAGSVSEGVSLSLAKQKEANDTPICAFGSLYSMGEIRNCFMQAQ